jgi:hypothetical protein
MTHPDHWLIITSSQVSFIAQRLTYRMKRLAAVLGVLALLVIVVILAAIGCGGEVGKN